MDIDLTSALVLAGVSLISALVAVFLLPLIPRRSPSPGAESRNSMVFLFDGEHLVDATPDGRRFLAGGPKGLTDWQRFCALIVPRFPGFPERMERLPKDGSALLTEAGGEAQLTATWLDGVIRLTLQMPRFDEDAGLTDAQSLAALTAELATLRDVVEAMPTPAWQQDDKGGVAWANSAYLDIVRSRHDAGQIVWPLPVLFSQPKGEPGSPHRQVIDTGSGSGTGAGRDRWFDCVAVEAHGASLHFALPADATVRAETALRNFVQTLTKTFAELPIGLAVFNRRRELVLFNPAMSELFNLEPEFLTGRPTLLNVLDRLRETRMMPEPKNYRSWREQILRLERDASDGVYSDTWTLPGGQVYRVTGRPHPDGAVAFLFEDISTEMSMTRRFRGEIETGQAVIDSLPEAIVVFSSAGVLTLSNSAYAELWGEDPRLVMGTTDIAGATAKWQAQCLLTQSEAAADLSHRIRQREAWSCELIRRDGRRLDCFLKPVAGGCMMVEFRDATQADAADAHPVPRASTG
ncbi:PAS domain-containing protein [Rhodovulum visakhapatnamense]|uniref:PAS domain-containing protein n=2 Tax=Rhodovulum visakhapatnamense TaxID=364297 RepID=A0A4R8G6W3_9RHOB|nr:PAS domain-containing protein [Rhodovulum visakhapatnamense]